MWKPVHIYVIRPPSVTPLWIEELTGGVGFEPVDEYLSSPKYETRPKDLILAYDHNGINIQSAYVMEHSIRQKVGGFRRKVPSLFNMNSGIDYGYAWNTAYEDADASDLALLLSHIMDKDQKYMLFASARVILSVCDLLPQEIRRHTRRAMKRLSLITPNKCPHNIDVKESFGNPAVEKLQHAVAYLTQSVRHLPCYSETDRYEVDVSYAATAIICAESAAGMLRKDGGAFVSEQLKKCIGFDRMMDCL